MVKFVSKSGGGGSLKEKSRRIFYQHGNERDRDNKLALNRAANLLSPMSHLHTNYNPGVINSNSRVVHPFTR